MMHLSIYYSVILISAVAAGNILERFYERAENNCTTLMDLFIVLDSSGSIGSYSFEEAKSALVDLVSLMDIAPKKVQVWVINYGQTVENPIAFHNMPMSEYTKQNLIQKIKAIRYMNGGCTATGDALAEAKRICGQRCRGLNEGVSRVALVLTDGHSNCGASVGVASSELNHITKASVFAIGIGNGINNAELLTIATERKYVMHVSSYLNLTTAINSITVQTCGIPAFVIINTKVESEVPMNTYRYYQLNIEELFPKTKGREGAFVEIVTQVAKGKVEVFTSTTDSNPNGNTAKHVQFEERGAEHYYIEYVDQSTTRFYFSFYGVQQTNEYNFVVNWLDLDGTIIG